ncbi:MAG: RNA polymerase sigma factor [Chloroflexota bacterium]|nr:sigma-70 family RNA polymerase sigma factor [Anaerolineales bacterium]MCA9977849.1 sigma-70 family RNA polymerase sigma factor [Anaerolineales bacterium]MCB8967406.1 sigma-70 family RNA polymerase sigma factor [Ardenticatenaceae bacterium]
MITNLVMAAPEALPLLEEEQALVQQAQTDLSVFSQLYQRHVKRVYRYLLVRVGNEQDAQDLTSQTFLAAMEGLHTYRGQQQFVAWLLGIARHKVGDQYRRRRPDLLPETAESLPDHNDGPDELIDRRLEIERVAQKLSAIAPERAEALSLRLFAGLEVAEIAQVMEKNEAAVRMLVFRGLRDLQAQLQVEAGA